jgi:hypothetical protein
METLMRSSLLSWFHKLLYGKREQKQLPRTLDKILNIDVVRGHDSLDVHLDKPLRIYAPLIVLRSTEAGLWLNPQIDNIPALVERFEREQDRHRAGNFVHVPFKQMLAHKRAHQSSAMFKAEAYRKKKGCGKCGGCSGCH